MRFSIKWESHGPDWGFGFALVWTSEMRALILGLGKGSTRIGWSA